MLQPQTHSHAAEIGFQLPLLHHVSFSEISATSLLEEIQYGLKGLKYFVWDVTVSVFLIKSLPPIGWDLQHWFSAEEDSTHSSDSSFSVYKTYGSDCVSFKMLLHAQWSQSFKKSYICSCDISSGPYGEIFWASLPGQNGLILTVSNSQSWRVRLRIQMDFISVFHNTDAGKIRALVLPRPFLRIGEWL